MKKYNSLKIIYTFFLFLIVTSINACGALTSTSVSIEDRTKIYSSSYVDVFKSVLDYCGSEGYPILTMDNELGIIQTDYKSRGGGFSGRIKLNFNLREFDKNKTKIILMIKIEEQDTGGNWQAKQSMFGVWEDWYNLILNDISERL